MMNRVWGIIFLVKLLYIRAANAYTDPYVTEVECLKAQARENHPDACFEEANAQQFPRHFSARTHTQHGRENLMNLGAKALNFVAIGVHYTTA